MITDHRTMNLTKILKYSQENFRTFLKRVNGIPEIYLYVPYYYDSVYTLKYQNYDIKEALLKDNLTWELSAYNHVVWREKLHTYFDREFYEKIMHEPNRQKFITYVMNIGTELLLKRL